MPAMVPPRICSRNRNSYYSRLFCVMNESFGSLATTAGDCLLSQRTHFASGETPSSQFERTLSCESCETHRRAQATFESCESCAASLDWADEEDPAEANLRI